MSKANKRQDWIDVLRALAMAFVVYTHQVPDWTEFAVFASPITIPLFFALTGYVSNYSHTGMVFFKNMLRRIVIPWLIITIVPEFISYIINGWDVETIASHTLQYSWEVLSGQETWYFPCYIIATTIFFCLNKIYKNNQWILIIISLMLFPIGLGLVYLGFSNIFMISTALCVQPYICLGKIFKTYIENNAYVSRHKNIVMLVGVAVYLGSGILSIVLYPGQCLDVHLNKYYNFLLCGIMIIVGIYTLFFLSKSLKKHLKPFVIVGRNTFVIYLIERRVGILGTSILKSFNIEINKLSAVLILVFVLTLGTLISICLKRFLPFLMGIQRKKPA